MRTPGRGWSHIPDVEFLGTDSGVQLLEFKTSNGVADQWKGLVSDFAKLFSAVQEYWAQKNAYNAAATSRLTWCLSTYLGAANDALRIFLEKRMIPKFSAAPGIYEEWRLNKGINGRRGTHLAYLALRRFWTRRYGMSHVRGLTYLLFVRTQRAAGRAKGKPLDSWRRTPKGCSSRVPPELASLLRRHGAAAVLGLPTAAASSV